MPDVYVIEHDGKSLIFWGKYALLMKELNVDASNLRIAIPGEPLHLSQEEEDRLNELEYQEWLEHIKGGDSLE